MAAAVAPDKSMFLARILVLLMTSTSLVQPVVVRALGITFFTKASSSTAPGAHALSSATTRTSSSSLWNAPRGGTESSAARNQSSGSSSSSSSIIFDFQNHTRNYHQHNNSSSNAIANRFKEILQEDGNKRIMLPNPPHGYRTVPFSWSELQQICDPTTGDLSYLSRSVEQQYQYELYRRQMKVTWKSVYDHILCSKFGFAEQYDDQTGLKYAKVDNDISTSSPSLLFPKLVVLPNSFPYYLEENIEHWVLWKLSAAGAGAGAAAGATEITDKEIEQAKQDIVRHKLSNNTNKVVQDFIHWINPPHLKSVPEIDHVHILCRLAPQPSSSKGSSSPLPTTEENH